MALTFYPNMTKVMFLDLEYYVPAAERNRKTPNGMLFSPVLPTHKIIGGVFAVYYPMLDQVKNPLSIWEWKAGSEKQVLIQMFKQFELLWKGIENNEKLGSPMLAGIGITHSDIPALYAKFNAYKIASPERIHDVLYGCRQIDMSIAAMSQYSFNTKYFSYPKHKGDLYQKYLKGKTMESGKAVWDLYEAKNYPAIENRTLEEVDDAINIWKGIVHTKKKTDSSIKWLAKLEAKYQEELLTNPIYKRVFERAVEVFKDPKKASHWLGVNHQAIQGVAPKDLCNNDTGATIALNLLDKVHSDITRKTN